MKEIRVEKAKLLETLRRNKTEHREIFLEALEGYRKQAIKLFEAELERAKAGKHFNIYFQLAQPSDQTKDYDRVIGMLEMDTETHIALSEQDYRQYVLDDWNWKGNFLTANSTYSAKALIAMEGSQQQ